MSRKKILYIVLALSLLLNASFVFSGCVRQLYFTGKGLEPSSATAKGTKDFSDVEDKLKKIDSVIDEYYLNEADIDREAMIEGIYSGYVSGLNEKYTNYYTADAYADLMESSSGEYSGIGVSVSQNINTGIITVITPFENGPGYAAGIRKDDILFKVEDEEVTGVDITQVVTKIKGEAGTIVNLTVYRPSTDEYIDMAVERQIVQNPTVEYEMKNDGIGYIKVSEFDEVTVGQFKTAISDLESQGMKGLIFDLRDNPGGLLSSVCDMLDRILPEGDLIVYTMDKDGNKEEHFAKDAESLDLPMIVLVNGNSASASEIFTAALKDYEKAAVMGTTTFGKGIVQVIIPLGDGSAVKVTQSQYYTPKGICIHGDGVTPDIEVEYDKENEGDNQLDAAMEQMMQMIAE